jgi:diguanylate cyclase (GGDEF)-like protein/PAS domain S-box-containing protein
MAETTLPENTAGPSTAPETFEFPVAKGIVELTRLLDELDHGAPRAEVLPSVVGPQVDNQLVQVRLGIASSLYAALRCRYAASASHALRVALNASAWATRLNLPTAERDAIEVAALLHDVGLIGVPDQVLLKPGPLDHDETLLVEQSRRMTVEILRGACAEPRILAIVENVGGWFDGSKGGYRFTGRDIPLGARMIAILEAFDSMTSDHVFRRAMSQERAIRELFESAGSQFDPGLVHEFAEFHVGDQTALRREVAKRWLHALDPEAANSYWELGVLPVPAGREGAAGHFESRLLENMHDAVVFIDAGFRIVEWNRGAERMTGIASASVYHSLWSPALLNMQNEKGDWLAEQDCPVYCAIHSHVQSLRRLTITGRGGRPVAIDSHVIPVTAADNAILGAVLLMHDASPETSLEQRCQTLYEKATKDPLTQVANRAEFDRVLDMFVDTHRQRQVTCSLIICDLDHFKRVNDTYGHQAGDEVIQCLAAVLKSSCRPGDLVARYGGEEFVMLCADCDNATAARRADQARMTLGRIQQPKLAGRAVTASFGVTEVQPGDTPETMLRRADRALLMAKGKGRNMVVQLGIGAEQPESAPAPKPQEQTAANVPVRLEQSLVTPVPLAVAIEKLRGFVADHQAKILKVDGNCVQLLVEDAPRGRARRSGDRPTAFCVEANFDEQQVQKKGEKTPAASGFIRTRVHVVIVPKKSRDRRREEAYNRAKEVLVSFRSYLMANHEDAGSPGANPGGASAGPGLRPGPPHA